MNTYAQMNMVSEPIPDCVQIPTTRNAVSDSNANALSEIVRMTDCNLNSLLSKLTAIERFLYNAEPRVEKDAQPDCMVDAVRIVADKVIEADARLEKIMACLGV